VLLDRSLKRKEKEPLRSLRNSRTCKKRGGKTGLSTYALPSTKLHPQLEKRKGGGEKREGGRNWICCHSNLFQMARHTLRLTQRGEKKEKRKKKGTYCCFVNLPSRLLSVPFYFWVKSIPWLQEGKKKEKDERCQTGFTCASSAQERKEKKNVWQRFAPHPVSRGAIYLERTKGERKEKGEEEEGDVKINGSV